MSFFFNDTATTEIYTLSLHDALPIFGHRARVLLRHVEIARVGGGDELHFDGCGFGHGRTSWVLGSAPRQAETQKPGERSEEHTSELQSRQYLVCRLLLEKKKSKPIAF